jgi:hypothetical protein
MSEQSKSAQDRPSVPTPQGQADELIAHLEALIETLDRVDGRLKQIELRLRKLDKQAQTRVVGGPTQAQRRGSLPGKLSSMSPAQLSALVYLLGIMAALLILMTNR